MKDFYSTFSNKVSTCLFFMRFCYDYAIAVTDTILTILLGYYYESEFLFLSMTANVSIVAGLLAVLLSIATPYIKKKVADNSFFGYITPIAFVILGSAFFACIFTGHGLYACYVGVALQSIIRPFRYTFYGSFVNSTWAESSDEIKALQAFNSAFSSRPAKWFAAFMMIVFVVSTSFSGNMMVLAASVAIATTVWLVSVYYAPKTPFKKEKDEEKKDIPVEYGRKFWYWAIISTLSIVCATLLHMLKDVVNAKLIGTALLPTIRFWTVLPVVALFYAAGRAIKDSFLEKNEYFVVTLLLFGAMFMLFAVLFPYSGILQSFAIASFLPTALTLMLQNWFFIVFTMFCEIWPIIITGTVIYPMQNEYFNKDEMFSVIPKITIMQSIGEFASGFAMKFMSAYQLPINTVVMIVAALVIVCIAAMIFCHYAMNADLRPKYLLQAQIDKMMESRYKYRNKFIKILSIALCFGLGTFALASGFNIVAAALMLCTTAMIMSNQITAVKTLSGFGAGSAASSGDLKSGIGDERLGLFGKGIDSNYKGQCKYQY
jgi:ATP/ADP translocase